jgi:hypothetical protein
MASAKPLIRLPCIGVLLLLGLAAGCKSSSNEKLDAGQRKYCSDSVDGGRGDGAEVPQATEAGTMDLALDGQVPIDAPVAGLDGTTADVADAGAGVDAVDSGRSDLATGPGAPDGSGGAGGTDTPVGTGGAGGTGGTTGAGGTPGAGGAVGPDASPDVRPDAGSEVKDAFSSDTVAPTDLGSSEAIAGADALVDSRGPDVPADAPSSLPDTVPVSIVDAPARDVPIDSLPAACGVNGCVWANRWSPPTAGLSGSFSGLSMAGSGTLWAAGQVNGAFNFGTDANAVTNLYTGPLPSSVETKNPDIVLLKLDPATGLATAAFDFGDSSGANDQLSAGVAVASSGNVGVIGVFNNEIDFTLLGSDSGVLGFDYLQTSISSTSFYATFDGTSTGSYVTPIKEHMVDLGTGSLTTIASNPGQNAFVVCGQADKVVTQSTNRVGLLTTTSSWVTGNRQDIVVAKINAADGTVLWGQQIGGAGDQVCQSAAIDNNGDVIISGYYGVGTPASFFTTSSPVPALGMAFIFVAKLDGTTGNVVAAQGWGSTGRSDANAILVDSSNNILLAGDISGAVDFGNDANSNDVSIAYLGLTDAFVAKFTSALAPIWAKSYGDAAHDQTVNGIAADSSGNVFVGGTYGGGLGGLGGLGLNSASPTSPDAFIAELAGADGSLLCARAYGDAVGTQGILPGGVVSGAAGGLPNAVFIGGRFASSMTLGSTTITTPGAGIQSPFVARLSP